MEKPPFHLSWVTSILTRWASVPPENKILETNDHDDQENTADMEDDLSNNPCHNRSDILGDNPSEPEPTTQSNIASMQMMMEEEWEMRNNTIQ